MYILTNIYQSRLLKVGVISLKKIYIFNGKQCRSRSFATLFAKAEYYYQGSAGLGLIKGNRFCDLCWHSGTPIPILKSL